MGLPTLPKTLTDEKMNWIRSIFSKTYHAQGLVQFDEDMQLTICGCSVKWLERVCVLTTSQKRADKLMFEYFREKYPEYKNHIQLF
jgi:hypothetical protein